MNQFMACMCDNDLNQLVVSGEPTAEEKAEAWVDLFYEYCDLAEAAETRHRTRLIAEINIQKQKNELAQGWVNMLSVVYDENIAKALHIIGYNFAFDPKNEKQYLADIKRVNALLIHARFSLKIKEAELEAIIKAQSTKDTVDKKYFKTMFFRINNYAKREAVNGQTTVEAYCAALRDFVSYIDSHKKLAA